MNSIHYTHCPLCRSAAINPVLSAEDYTVSHETFIIAECSDCSVRFTQDVPDSQSISPYYKSEAYISHTNTSKGLINSVYQLVRKKTMIGKRKLVQKATRLQQGKLLDVGSGIGTFAHEMKQSGWDVTGLEPDEDARNIAARLYPIELTDITQFYKLPAGSFDVITLWHVLEHVHDLQDYIQQLKRLLSEKGKLFIAVPNYTSKDATAYKECWAAYDVPRHLYHFSPRAMQVLMERNGLKVEKHKAMWFDSFYISMLSSKYKNGKSNIMAACWYGLLSNIAAFGDTRKCSSVIYIIGK
ncbi:MAG TPA: class I SAM-dependent methyltransferase [Chitinophagaceae bacterium]